MDEALGTGAGTSCQWPGLQLSALMPSEPHTPSPPNSNADSAEAEDYPVLSEQNRALTSQIG